MEEPQWACLAGAGRIEDMALLQLEVPPSTHGWQNPADMGVEEMQPLGISSLQRRVGVGR